MNYELAKELKDAGFPQKGRGKEIAPTKCDIHEMPRGAGYCRECGFAYAPTLEELIEACQDGKHTFELTWSAVTKKWTAGIWYPAKQCEHHVSCQCAGIGKFIRAEWYSTRKEAVTRLWLALNKHETQP